MVANMGVGMSSVVLTFSKIDVVQMVIFDFTFQVFIRDLGKGRAHSAHTEVVHTLKQIWPRIVSMWLLVICHSYK